jgi:hypothetical protein
MGGSGMNVGQVTVAASLASVSIPSAELDGLAAELATELEEVTRAFAFRHAVGIETRVAQETSADIKRRVHDRNRRMKGGSGT